MIPAIACSCLGGSSIFYGVHICVIPIDALVDNVHYVSLPSGIRVVISL